MSKVEEQLAKSLTAETVDLLPYLPYLLQDLWELGSSSKDMIHLIAKNVPNPHHLHILDLACGKGAVSIQLTKALGCHTKGIDLMPEFIEEAKKMAQIHEVTSYCTFEVGDINQSVMTEKGYDLVILGAVGEVLGSNEATLHQLSATIKKGGYVLLDDAYAKEKMKKTYTTKKQWLQIIQNAGFLLIDELLVNDEEFSGVLEEQMFFLQKRTDELKVKFPNKASLFDDYMKSQLQECDELEHDVIGVTLLLQKK
ncbi:MAG: class I SAM-dependent methyltransferase [Bacilli bacterium]|nr:class I SAM-dependent methyltransferase [Bacilli bacterium]